MNFKIYCYLYTTDISSRNCNFAWPILRSFVRNNVLNIRLKGHKIKEQK